MVDNHRARGTGPGKSPSPKGDGHRQDSSVPVARHAATPPQTEARPWRQWHGAGRPKEVAPLEVTVARKPQWGRHLYLLIILGIALFLLRTLYLNVFWINAQGMVSGRHYNIAPSQTVSIKDVLVTPSIDVEEGQPLVYLDSPELVQSLARNQEEISRLQDELIHRGVQDDTRISEIEAEIAALESKQSTLEAQYNRERQQLTALEELVTAGAAQSGHLDELNTRLGITLSEYRRTQAQLNSHQSQLALLREHERSTPEKQEEIATRLASLQMLQDSIRTALESLELKAPAAGSVARVQVSRGDVLQAGEPAMVLVDKHELRAYLYFPPSAQQRLQEGMIIPFAMPDGSKIDLQISTLYPSMESVPPQFRAQRDAAASSALVVEAMPLDGGEFPAMLTSGTPIQGRIPRWNVTSAVEGSLSRAGEWFRDAKRVTGGFIGEGLADESADASEQWSSNEASH